MILVLFKKFLGKREFHHHDRDTSEPMEDRIIRIQQGDIRLRNQFITDYQPYIAKVTSRFCKRYIDPSADDEFSIALDAFNEAINKFSADAGASFLSFSETVIRRRLIDHVRKEQRFSQQIPYSSFEIEDEEDSVVNPVEIHQAIEQYELEKTIDDRRLEIIELQRKLNDFGVSFSDLVELSPKHTDSRDMMLRIGKLLADDGQLMSSVLSKKMLPIKELLEKTEVSRKTLERHRKYLIAIALIHIGPYPYLKDYLHIPEEDVEGSEKSE